MAMLPSAYVFLSAYPCAWSWVFSVVLGGADLSKWGWRKQFVASEVRNVSFGSNLGQLFHLQLCKPDWKYWSHLKQGLRFFFTLLPSSSLQVWVLQIHTGAAQTVIRGQHQQMKAPFLLRPLCCASELLLQLHRELDSESWIKKFHKNSLVGCGFSPPSLGFSTQFHYGVAPNIGATLGCII